MTGVYTPNTAGPWLLDDDGVVLDGVAYVGTLFPYGQSLPTLDGTFPDPTEIIRRTGIYDPFVRSHGRVTDRRFAAALAIPKTFRGSYLPNRAMTGHL